MSGLLISLWDTENPLFVGYKYVTPTGKPLMQASIKSQLHSGLEQLDKCHLYQPYVQMSDRFAVAKLLFDPDENVCLLWLLGAPTNITVSDEHTTKLCRVHYRRHQVVSRSGLKCVLLCTQGALTNITVSVEHVTMSCRVHYLYEETVK